jgi:hypothetical protein
MTMQGFGGTPEGKAPLGRFRHRWEYSIKIDLKDMRSEGAGYIYWAQDGYIWRALVNTATGFRNS